MWSGCRETYTRFGFATSSDKWIHIKRAADFFSPVGAAGVRDDVSIERVFKRVTDILLVSTMKDF